MADKKEFSPLLVDSLPGLDFGRVLNDIDQMEKDNDILSRKIIGEKQIHLFEKFLELQLEALSFAAENAKQWSLSDRVIVAMAARVFNHLRASFKLLLAGYWAESLVLDRSAHEAMSRELFFYCCPEKTELFFKGEQIWQKEVDKQVAQKLAQGEAIKEALRGSYRYSSQLSHPNLLAIQLQTLSDNKEEIGSKTILGPVLLREGIFAQQFAGLIALALSATRILAAVGLYQATDTWRDELEELEESAKSLFSTYGVRLD